MRALAGAGVLAALAAAGGGTALLSGIYDVSATDQHTAAVYWLIDTTVQRSVARHASRIAVPPLSDPSLAARGLRIYTEHCVQCHGAPGVAPEPFALGLRPVPANLAQTGRRWEPARIFWAVKYGLKLTGMPAWQYRLAEDELWAVVAFVRQLPAMSPAQYQSAAGFTRKLEATAREANAPPRPPDATRGRHAIDQYGCPACHRIPGVVGADADVGPPLARFARREYIAGILPHTAENLVRWLTDPPALDPLTAMPALGLSEQDARDIAAFLATLR